MSEQEAMGILNARLASGEVSIDEYERLKSVLTGTSPMMTAGAASRMTPANPQERKSSVDDDEITRIRFAIADRARRFAGTVMVTAFLVAALMIDPFANWFFSFLGAHLDILRNVEAVGIMMLHPAFVTLGVALLLAAIVGCLVALACMGVFNVPRALHVQSKGPKPGSIEDGLAGLTELQFLKLKERLRDRKEWNATMHIAELTNGARIFGFEFSYLVATLAAFLGAMATILLIG